MRLRTRVMLSAGVGLVTTLGVAWTLALANPGMNDADWQGIGGVRWFSHDDGARRFGRVAGFGWPLPAMASEYAFEGGHHAAIAGLEIGGEWGHGWRTVPRTLPTRVLLTGFVLDWAIHALAIWFVLSVVDERRRGPRGSDAGAAGGGLRRRLAFTTMLGAATTVAAAWALAYWTNPLERRSLEATWYGGGARRVEGRAAEGRRVGIVATGWPLVSMASEYDVEFQDPQATSTERGMEIAGDLDGDYVARRALPTRILWRGALTDVAVTCSAWWFLLTFPADVRRSIRRRRGRCVACAYPIDGEKCPECGRGVAA